MKTKKEQQNVTATQALKFCIKWAFKYPWMVVGMLIPAVFSPIEAALVPFMTKKIINIVTEESNAESLSENILPTACWLILILFAWETCWRLYGYIVCVRNIPRLRKSFVIYALDKLFTKSFRYYQDNMSGSISKRVMDLSDYPISLMYFIFNKFLIKIGVLVGALVMLWSVKIEFAYIIIVWIILFVATLIIFFPKILKRSEAFSAVATSISGQISDCFSNMVSVRLFANWDLERKIINKTAEDGIQKEQKVELTTVLMFSIFSYSFVAVQAIALYFLVKYKIEGSITIGDFAMILALNYNIVYAAWCLSSEIADFTRHLGKTQQALKDIFAEVEVLDEKNAKNLVVENGEIEFKNVYFRYNDTVENTFENFSCIIRPGQKVGLVGESGAGKTSFVNLLMRTYDIQQGEIIIDKQNIAKVTQDSLHKNIGVIPQDPSLFHRTLFENIQYGDPQKSEAEVYEAAKNASAHEFILSTPDGYKSLVGERGVKISGGQRQRIAMARAFFKNAPILILDEATSALDSITERDIQTALWNLMKNKTCIVVAHRLSTLVEMDRILVFDEGKIVQDGTHIELSTIDGIYRNLWNTQVNGFIMVD